MAKGLVISKGSPSRISFRPVRIYKLRRRRALSAFFAPLGRRDKRARGCRQLSPYPVWGSPALAREPNLLLVLVGDHKMHRNNGPMTARQSTAVLYSRFCLTPAETRIALGIARGQNSRFHCQTAWHCRGHGEDPIEVSVQKNANEPAGPTCCIACPARGWCGHVRRTSSRVGARICSCVRMDHWKPTHAGDYKYKDCETAPTPAMESAATFQGRGLRRSDFRRI